METQIIAEDVPDNALVRDHIGTYYFKNKTWGYLIKGAGEPYQIILNFDPVSNTRRTRSEEEIKALTIDNSWIPKPFLWFKRGFFQLVTVVENSLSSEQVGKLINNFEKENSNLEHSIHEIIDIECNVIDIE